MKLYIGSALTGLEEKTREYVLEILETIEKVCRKYDVACYLPHKKTDPIKHADVSSRDVYVIDKEQIINSDIVVAYLGIPSTGVGSEIEIANSHGKPVLMLIEERRVVSRMVNGNPAIKERIVFKSIPDLESKFERWLIEKITEENLKRFAIEYGLSAEEYFALQDISMRSNQPLSVKDLERIYKQIKRVEKKHESGQRRLSDFWS